MATVLTPPTAQGPETSGLEIIGGRSPHPEGFFDPQVLIPDGALVPTYDTLVETYVGSARLRGTVETPLTVADPTNALWVQGYMGPELVYAQARHAMTQHDRVAATMGRAGVQLPFAHFHRNHFMRPHTVTKQSPGAMMKAIGAEKYDLIGHSMGGPLALEAAQRYPKYVRTLTLMGSAGLTGHGIPDLAARLPAAAAEIRQSIPALKEMYGAAGALAIANYFLVNPLRPIGEAIYVARADIRDQLMRLREEHGIKIIVMAFANDCFFDEHVMYDMVADKVDKFAVLEAELAGHIAPQLLPKLVGGAAATSIEFAVAA